MERSQDRPEERSVPEPLPFDPVRAEPPALAPPTGEGTGVVVLWVADAPGEDGWPERSAVALARGWTDRGRRVLLADVALARPRLHDLLEAENGEGLADALLFGSSVARVARPVDDGRFLFVPAGTATARPQDVTASPRWASVIEAGASVDSTLVLFVPSDLPGGEALLAGATDVLVLTDRDAAPAYGRSGALGGRVRAVLVPPAPVDGASSEEEGEARAAVFPHQDEFELESVPAEPSSGREDADLDPFPDIVPIADALLPGSDLDGSDADPDVVFDLTDFDGLVEVQDPVPTGGRDPEDAPQAASSSGAASGPEDGHAGFDPSGAESTAAVATLPEPEARPLEPDRPRPSRPTSPGPAARPAARPGPPPRSRLPILLGILVLSLLAAAALAWFGVVELPFLSSWMEGRRPAEASTPSEPVLGPPGLSLSLGSFTEPAVARLERHAGSPAPLIARTGHPIE